MKWTFFTGERKFLKTTLAVTLSGIFFIAASVILKFSPIQYIANRMLTLCKGSYLFNKWENPPLEIYIAATVFNITNLEAFLKNEHEKIRVEEVGPFVYREFLENRNATFNANNTLSYKPVRRIEFIPEKSVGDPSKMYVTVANIPYMGVTSAASKASYFAAMGIRALTKLLNSEMALNMTVEDYLMGYEDNLVELASATLPQVIHFRQFGILERMLDEGNNIVTINLPKPETEADDIGENNSERDQNVKDSQNDDENSNYDDYFTSQFDAFGFEYRVERKRQPIYKPKARDFSIDMWNGGAGLEYWGYNKETPHRNQECNTLRGAYDGTLFPRNITVNETFRIYRKSFCRTLPIIYTHQGKVHGVDAYFFELANYAFDSNLEDPKTSCYCLDDKCLRKGLGDITPCYYSIPAAVSFPHFYNGDPSLLKEVDGLSPDKEKHGSEIVLQPQLGIPMRVRTRFQINLVMGDVMFNQELQKFSNTVLPLAWLEIRLDDLTFELKALLYLLFIIGPILLGIIIVVLYSLGIFGFGFYVYSLYKERVMRFIPVYVMPHISWEEENLV